MAFGIAEWKILLDYDILNYQGLWHVQVLAIWLYVLQTFIDQSPD